MSAVLDTFAHDAPAPPAIGPYPFSPEFQERAVALALHDRGFYARSRRFFRPEFFDAPHVADVVRALAAFFERHRVVPSRESFPEVVADAAASRGLKPAVADAWRGVAERVAAAPASDDAYVREKMLDWVRSQTMASTAMRVAEMYERARRNGGVNGHHAEFLKVMEDAVAACADVAGGTWLDYFDDLVPRIYADHNAMRTTTGYPTLDEKLEGGIDRGELFQFLGGWSRGKTSLLVGMARGCLLHRLRVLVVTNEVSPRRWAARLDRAILGKTRAEILADPRRSIRAIARLRQVRGRLIIQGFPSGSATCEDVEALLVRLRDEEDFVPDRLIVDYADEMAPTRNVRDHRLGQLEIYSGLRAIAQRWDIGAATAGQADSAADGATIVKGKNQAEAKGKNAIVDICVSISQTDEEAERKPFPECRLVPVKVREGARFEPLPFVFDASRGVIVPAGDGAPAARPGETVVRFSEPAR